MLTGCASAPEVSQAGRDLCRRQSAAVANPFARPFVERRCLRTVEQVLRRQRQKAARGPSAADRLEASVKRCRERQPTVSSLMVALRRAERNLADVKAEEFLPAAPPQAPDEAMLARFRREDQEFERERHEAELAAWRDREADRRSAWRASHRQRLERAQTELDRAARELRDMEPSLFTGPGSIEFDVAVARRVTLCDRHDLAAVAATASEAASPKQKPASPR
jgi:hypothetical protein